MAARAAKVEVYEDSAGQFRWRLRARNGRIICTPGESFTTRRGAWRSAGTVHDTLPTAVYDDDTD